MVGNIIPVPVTEGSVNQHRNQVIQQYAITDDQIGGK